MVHVPLSNFIGFWNFSLIWCGGQCDEGNKHLLYFGAGSSIFTLFFFFAIFSTNFCLTYAASENPFKGIFTTLPRPGGGEFGKFYSLPALNDPRIGMDIELVLTGYNFFFLCVLVCFMLRVESMWSCKCANGLFNAINVPFVCVSGYGTEHSILLSSLFFLQLTHVGCDQVYILTL